ncbi:unnamed protein product, partial [marine sediment metagenome]
MQIKPFYFEYIVYKNYRNLVCLMEYFNNKNNIYKKIISINLKLLIVGTSLFVYKYVYHFKINQEMSFKLFAIILFSLWILKIL